MAKRVKTIINEIGIELDKLFQSDREVRGIWEKYVKYGDLSSISYRKEGRTDIITFYFEGKAYGDSYSDREPKLFSRLSDSLFDKVRPKWFYNWRGKEDINVSNEFVIESVIRFIESLTGKKIYNIYYQCSYD